MNIFLFLKKPKPSLHWDTYNSVFNPHLSIFCIIVFLICSFVLYFVFFYLDKEKKKRNVAMDSLSAICTILLNYGTRHISSDQYTWKISNFKESNLIYCLLIWNDNILFLQCYIDIFIDVSR